MKTVHILSLAAPAAFGSRFPVPKRSLSALVAGGFALLLPASVAAAEPDIVMPLVVVAGTNLPASAERVVGAALDVQRPEVTPATRSRVADSAALLQGLPGVAVVRNGPLTGSPQLRGLSGDRVRTEIDGQTLTPACPNHMDPPLHYASPQFVDTAYVLPGIAPVSLGGDSIGGTVIIRSAPPTFSRDDRWRPSGEFESSYRGADDGFSLGGRVGVADRRRRLSYQGGWQQGKELRYPGGRVRDTGYDLSQHRVQLAIDTLPGLWSLDLGLTRTRDAGTPALPMDMIEDDGYGASLRFEGEHQLGPLEGSLFFHHTDHLMDNFSLRPAGPMRMASPAESDDLGLRLDTGLRREADLFRVGPQFTGNLFDAYQRNEATGARQDTLNEASRWRAGLYAEWQRDWSPEWRTTVGVRNDNVLADASDVEHFFPAAAGDAAAFNARDHAFTDVNLDATAAVRWSPWTWGSFEAGAARKTRSPSSLERFLWTPLSASAGQADGRTYLGNLDLDPEVSHQLGVTADFHGDRWQIRVSPFYNWVSDYIQGVPIARVDAAGRPVLRFQNLDLAELYGIDGDARWRVTTNVTVRGNLSYVRGTTDEPDDNLYRIAPLRGTVALDLNWWRLDGSVEVVMAARQDDVAAYNAEPVTPGYTLWHLRAGFRFNPHLRLDAGVENVFDELYADHLSGVNRVAGGDLPVGARIPGAGRFGYVSLSAKF